MTTALPDDFARLITGGVALNSQVGGLDPHVVDLNLKMGGKMIWFPTISIKEHFVPRGVRQSDEVDIFDGSGDLRPEVDVILSSAKEAGALVSAGHMAPDRTLAMLTAAKARGLTRLIVSHPNYVVNADTGDVQKFVEQGAIIEHCRVMYDNEKMFPFKTLLDWIDLIGPEHTSLGSELPETYDSGFGLRLMLKDARIALDLLRSAGVPADLSSASVDLWAQASEALDADAGHTEIARWVQEHVHKTA